MAEIELDAGLIAPFERHLVDCPGALAPVHRGMEMPGRIEMRSAVGGQFHVLDGPAFAVRQIAGREAREHTGNVRAPCLWPM